MQATRDTEPNPQEAADIDQFRPAKKTKLEGGSLELTEEVREEMVDDDEDWDDIYGANQAAAENPASMVEQEVGSGAVLPIKDEESVQGAAAKVEEDVKPDASAAGAQEPPTFAIGSASKYEDNDVKPVIPAEEDNGDVKADHLTPNDVKGLSIHATPESEDAKPVAAELDKDIEKEMQQAGEDELVDEKATAVASTDEPSTRMIDEISEIERGQTGPNSHTATPQPAPQTAPANTHTSAADPQEGPETMTDSDYSSDTSNSDSSSDSDSDSDEDEEEFESMDAKSLAQMLVAGDGEDGGDQPSTGGDRQPRTANEAAREVRPLPNINITPATKVTRLGTIHALVDLDIVISGGAGGTQVVGLDSPICVNDKKLFGVVDDIIGTQTDTYYTVGVNSKDDIESFGLAKGVDVYYFDDHVKWEFPDHIRKMNKGTDASNIHDEEVDFDEQDFSDDEKEAEYKRMNKASKKSTGVGMSRTDFVNNGHSTGNAQPQRGGLGNARGDRGGRGGRGRGRDGLRTEIINGRSYTVGAAIPSAISSRGTSGGNDAPVAQFTGGLNYDDEPEVKTPVDSADGEYNVLRRPDNFNPLAAAPGFGQQPRRPSNDFGNRGGGARGGRDNRDGRGGRGDRGGHGNRGGDRRGRNNDNRGRGGNRGGHGQQYGGNNNNRSGAANSYPDAHNNFAQQPPQSQMPTQMQQYPPWNPQQQYQAYNQPQQQPQQAYQPQQQPQAYGLPNYPVPYPFNYSSQPQAPTPNFQQQPQQQQQQPFDPATYARYLQYYTAQQQQQQGGGAQQ